jgi:hypothetical protein
VFDGTNIHENQHKVGIVLVAPFSHLRCDYCCRPVS